MVNYIYCIILSILTQQQPCLLISIGVSSNAQGRKTNIPLFSLPYENQVRKAATINESISKSALPFPSEKWLCMVPIM